MAKTKKVKTPKSNEVPKESKSSPKSQNSSHNAKINDAHTEPPELVDFKLGKVDYDYSLDNIAPIEMAEYESEEESSSSLEMEEWEPEQLEKMKEGVTPELARLPPDLTWPPVREPEIPKKLEMFNTMWTLLDRDPDKRDEIKPDKLIVLYGKRGTGKSFAMRHLLYNLRHYIGEGFVMTNTPYNGFWQQYFPAKAVLKGFDVGKLHAFLDAKEKFIEQWRKTPWMQESINPYSVVVLEDCVNETNFNHVEAIRRIALNGRHLMLFCMIATQYTKAVGPVIRGNADYAFVLFQELFLDKEAVVENYMSALLNKYTKQFLMTWIDTVTQIDEKEGRRSVLVIDNQRQTIEMDKKLYTAQFIDPGPFLFGDAKWRSKVGD